MSRRLVYSGVSAQNAKCETDRRQTRRVTMSEPIIVVEDIHKSYLMGKEAVPALRGVSLEIQRGEFVCLMGPSGSGKTTLLNIVGGLDEPSRGHVIVDGENLVALSENELARLRLHKMGFIFQNYNLLANFTAQENVEAPMVLANIGRRERRERGHDSCWNGWTWATAPTITPASCPAGSSSAWPSPAPWPTIRPSSSATK